MRVLSVESFEVHWIPRDVQSLLGLSGQKKRIIKNTIKEYSIIWDNANPFFSLTKINIMYNFKALIYSKITCSSNKSVT